MLCAKRLKPAPVQTKVNSVSIALMCLAESEAFSSAHPFQCPTDSNQPRWGTARHGWIERTALKLIHAGNLSPKVAHSQGWGGLKPFPAISTPTRTLLAKRTAANCLRSVVESPPRRLARHLSGEGPLWLGKDICASCFGCLVCGAAGDLAVVFGGLWGSAHVPPRPLQDQVAVGSGNGRALLQAASRRALTISAVRGAEESMSCTCKTTRAWGSQVLPLRTADL